MIPPYVRGPIANVFTIFDEQGRFDEDGQRAFFDFLHKWGRDSISAYFVRSGMGQMYAFTYEEVERMAVLATSHFKGVAPVLVGTSGVWDRNLDRRPDPDEFLHQSIELSRFAQQCGADGVVLTVPEALAPSSGETCADVIVRYFTAISSAVSIPIFMYQPPPTIPPYQVTPDIVQRLASIQNVMGMKLSSERAGYLLDVAWAARGEDFALICGHEAAFYAGLCCGAVAVIGQGSCVNPAILKAVQDRFESGDWRGACEAQYAANRLLEAAPPAVEFMKRLANERGYNVRPYPRPERHNPYSSDPPPLSEEDFVRYRALLESELAKYQ